MVRIFLAWLLLCCAATTVFGQGMTLQLVSPDVLWPQDSIPESAGEQIVIAYEYTRTNGETGYLNANWVIALINRPYEQTRVQLHDVIREVFGIHSERELHGTVDSEAPVAPHIPKEPLFGDGFTDFHVSGAPITATREYRIETKQYNTHVRWWKSYSESEWRLIDGAPLFDKACTILVVSRTDHSREWVWMHPGIPMPFMGINDTRLVTDKETTPIATLLRNAGNPPVRYFVLLNDYEPRLKLNVMSAIREAVKDLPER